ncbi:hypothetical protein [Cohnella caldifontis]|uniref:hypothetical protein n=1 Tax=Cohnella caldifontis TaxID=3027471 RepID=UPI0023EB9712|nr:hypothetical protein [Cohnella sp. YIM B05605]
MNEIEAWRRSKLLPEHYCDFLQNLYLDDLNDRPKGAVETAVRKIGQAPRKRWVLVFGVFALICIVVLHFSAFPLALQIGLAGLCTTGFVLLGGLWREPRPGRSLLAMAAGMLITFGTGAAILELHGWTDGGGPIVLLAVCAALCIGCGLIVRQALIHGFGWLALIALYARLLFHHVSEPAWAETQLFWIPAALLFIWLSWFAHVRFKSVGIVLFANGLIVWYMPELQSALGGIDPAWVQAGLVGKTVLAGWLLYRFRNQWMEWVVR